MENESVLVITGKVGDLFSADITGLGYRDGYTGNVPSGLGIGGGDYIRLAIDIKTGKILNWVPPTMDTIEGFFPPQVV